MSTWTCPRCLNTVVDQDVCSVCNTYQPPINTTASTINEKSNPIEDGYSTAEMDAASVPRAEFFAESMVAYFKEPAELKRLCPGVYDEISGLLGADYGGAYSNSSYAIYKY